MQQSGGLADQEADSLLEFRTSGELEIVFKGHLAGQEIKQCGADAERGDGHRWDIVLIAVGENGFARLEGEKVQAIDVKIDIAEKFVEIAGVENGDVHFRIDVLCRSGQNLNLGLAQAAHHGAAHAGYGDPFVAQDRLLGLGDPADIS